MSSLLIPYFDEKYQYYQFDTNTVEILAHALEMARSVL
jgi:hypothetical protein